MVKGKILGLLLPIAALYTGLNADCWDIERNTTEWNGDYRHNEHAEWNGDHYECETDHYDYDQSSDDSCSCCRTGLGGLSFGVDGLYLWAYEDDNDYAGIGTLNAVGTTSTLAIDYQRPKYTGHMGYRLRAGYADPCGCFAVNANYFHYHTRATSRIRFANPMDPNPFIVPTSVSGFASINPQVAPIYKAADSRLKLTVNRVNLDVGRVFCINECWEFGPSIGVRWIDLQHRWDNFFATAIIEDTFTVESLRLENKFEGVGLGGGFRTQWNFCDGFGIYAGIDASFVCGNDRIRRMDNIDFTEIGEVERLSILNNGNRHPRAVWAGEASLGIAWTTTLCGCQTLQVLLGWEYQVYLHAASFDQTSILANQGSIASTPRAINLRTANLVLQGFVFGVTYTF